MKTTIQSILLLACIAFCTSQGPGVISDRCRCVQPSKHLTKATASRIINIQQLPPNPFCSKTEIIVTLNDGNSKCLNPRTTFTQKLLEAERRTKQKRSGTLVTTTISPVTSN